MISEPEELKGWKTTDGQIHPLKSEARSHQAKLELEEWLRSGEPPTGSAHMTLLEWIKDNWEKLNVLINIEADGHYDPDEN